MDLKNKNSVFSNFHKKKFLNKIKSSSSDDTSFLYKRLLENHEKVDNADDNYYFVISIILKTLHI